MNAKSEGKGFPGQAENSPNVVQRYEEATHLGPLDSGQGFQLDNHGLSQGDPADITVPVGIHGESNVGDDFAVLFPTGRLGTFRLLREIGRGGMGTVYEAIEESLHRHVALKVLPLAGLMDAYHIRRFQNEAAAAAQLSHPRIVPVYSVGVDRGTHYYAMKLIDGQDLAKVIHSVRQHLHRRDGSAGGDKTPRAEGSTSEGMDKKDPGLGKSRPLSTHSIGRDLTPEGYSAAIHSKRQDGATNRLFNAVARLGYEVSDALSHAHEQGVIHRDIKPSNLLLDAQGQVWITDFGLAMTKDTPGGTRTGDVVGTLRYMSPEQASGRRFLIDNRTDIYSLGVSLYELATLRQAFDGTGTNEILRQVCFSTPPLPRSINPKIPVELEIIILKCMSKNPQDRYTTAADLADDFQRFLNGKPIVARPPSVLRRLREWAQRHSMLATALVVLFFSMTVLSAASSAIIYPYLLSEAAQKKKAVSLLEQSEGLRHIANSAVVLPDNPGLALSLAVAGARLSPGREANAALQMAVDSNHELSMVEIPVASPWKLSLRPESLDAIVTSVPMPIANKERSIVRVSLKTESLLPALKTENTVTSASYSPLGRFVLTTSSPLARTSGPFSTTESTEFSPPTLWNAETGSQVLVFNQTHLPLAVESLFSRDEQTLLIPGPGNDVTAWNTSNGQSRFVLRGHQHPVLQAIFSPDNQLMASVDLSGVVRFWRTETGEMIREIETTVKPSEIDSLQFCNSRQRLIYSSVDGTRILDPNREDIAIFLKAPRAKTSVSGRVVATWHPSSDAVFVNDTQTGELISQLMVPKLVTAVAFSPDGESIAIASKSTIYIMHTANGDFHHELLGHEKTVRDLQFTDDGTTVVSVAEDKTVRQWSVIPQRDLRRVVERPDPRNVAQPSISDDDQYILSPSILENRVHLFEAGGNASPGAAPGALSGFTFETDRLCVSDGQTLDIIDPRTSRTVRSRRFAGQELLFTVPIIGKDSLVVVPANGSAELWNFANDTTVQLVGRDQSVAHCVVSPDNTRIAIATSSGLCVVADAVTGDILNRIKVEAKVWAVRFLPNSEGFVTVQDGNVASIWEPNNLTPVLNLQHTDVEFDFVFVTGDGKSVVTVKEIGTGQAAVWDAETGKLQHRITCESTTKFELHPSERQLALASRKEGLRLWRLNDDPVATLSPLPCTRVGFVGSTVVANQFPLTVSLSARAVLTSQTSLVADVVGYDMDTGQKVADYSIPGETGLGVFNVCPVTQQVAVNTIRFNCTINDRFAKLKSRRIGNHSQVISYSRFLPGSLEVVTCSWDGTASVWDANGGQRHELDANAGPIVVACLDQSGSRLVCGYRDGSVVDWNLKTGNEIRRLSDSNEPPRSIELDRSGNVLILAGEKLVRYWNIQLNTVSVPQVTPRIGQVSSSAYGSEILLISDSVEADAAGKQNGTDQNVVSIWKPATQSLLDLPLQQACVAGSFSPKGNVLALALVDGTVLFGKVSSENKFETLHQRVSDQAGIRRICFSPDGSLLAVGRESGITLLDVIDGEVFHELTTSDNKLIRFNRLSGSDPWRAFSASGKNLVAQTDYSIWWSTNPTDAALESSPRAFTDREKIRFRIGLNEMVMQRP